MNEDSTEHATMQPAVTAAGSDPAKPDRLSRGWGGLQALYLILAVLGAVLPWLANLEFMNQVGGGFDLGLFVSMANANPAAQSLSRDLLISSTAVSIWIVVESRRLKMRGLAATLGLCFGISFACGAPFFLYLRERRLRELSHGFPDQ